MAAQWCVRRAPQPTNFAIAQLELWKWDYLSRIGGATFSAGAGGSAG
jgi:hypothetical protein